MPLPNIDDFATLAGPLVNYTDVVDPTTDLPDYASNTARANNAAMTRMLERIAIEWTNDGVAGTVASFNSVIGNSSLYYPSFVRDNIGIWRLIWSPTVVDVLGEEAFWAFRYAEGCITSGSVPGKVQCEVIAPNIVRVRMWSQAVAPPASSDLAGTKILVKVT